jgi:hypothetical protein
MTGGRLNIFVSGRDSEGLRTNYDAQLMGGSISIRVAGDGSKAIKSKNKDNSLTVLDGGRLTLEEPNVIYTFMQLTSLIR